MSHEEKLDHQLDAERAVLGSLLVDGAIVRDVLSSVSEQDFLNASNRLIFQAARALFRLGSPVDAFTIRDKVGGQYSDYLAQLIEITPTSANWKAYAEAMHSQATLQRIKNLAQNLNDATTLDDCRSVCADLVQLMADGREVDSWTMQQLLDDFYLSQDPDRPAVEYVTCGFREIDEGSYMELGDVMMIGGYPSDGKTALALMMAYHMASRYKVGFFSLETDKRKLRDRMMANVGQIDFNDIKRRKLSDEDWAVLAHKQNDIANRDLTILRASGMSATDIQAVAQAYGFQVIFIDYVQLIAPEVDRRAPRSEQMADVSRSLHTFAQHSGTLVVELAQLTRQERAAGYREPDMHDLKESGQFEQDADIIFLLFRPNPKEEDLPAHELDKRRVFKIAKNKEGRRGKWKMHFDGSKQTFSMVAGDGKDVMRQLTSAGKAAKNRRHVEAKGQQSMEGFRDITGEYDPNFPF